MVLRYVPFISFVETKRVFDVCYVTAARRLSKTERGESESNFDHNTHTMHKTDHRVDFVSFVC